MIHKLSVAIGLIWLGLVPAGGAAGADNEVTGLVEFIRKRDVAWRESLPKRVRIREWCESIALPSLRESYMWDGNLWSKLTLFPQGTLETQQSTAKVRQVVSTIGVGGRWMCVTTKADPWRGVVSSKLEDQRIVEDLPFMWTHPLDAQTIDAFLADSSLILSARRRERTIEIAVAALPVVVDRLSKPEKQVWGFLGKVIVFDGEVGWRPVSCSCCTNVDESNLIGVSDGVPRQEFGGINAYVSMKLSWQDWRSVGAGKLPMVMENAEFIRGNEVIHQAWRHTADCSAIDELPSYVRMELGPQPGWGPKGLLTDRDTGEQLSFASPGGELGSTRDRRDSALVEATKGGEQQGLASSNGAGRLEVWIKPVAVAGGIGLGVAAIAVLRRRRGRVS
jgi:hypothetical protein